MAEFVNLGIGAPPVEYGETKWFRMQLPEEDRLRHTYILGAPGGGKTELLKLLIHHEITHDRAVVIVDAHSDLCQQVIAWPEFALSDRRPVMIAPNFIEGKIPTINFLQLPRGADERTKEILSNQLAKGIGEICLGEGGSTVSVRMVSVAKAAIRVLLDRPNSTLLDMVRIMSEEPPPALMKAGREHSDPAVREFFKSEWETSSYKASKDAIRARLYNLLLLSDFREMTCGRSTISLYDLMDGGRTILFSLGEAGGETAQVIGRMALSMIAAYGDLRKNTPRSGRRAVHVFVDECQNFVGAATQFMLTELRKYGVHLTLAHQFADQLPTEDLQAVLNATQVKMLGKTTYSPVVIKALGCDRDKAATLPRGHFFVQWGSIPLFELSARSDLADDNRRMRDFEWISLKASQRQYYRPLEGEVSLAAPVAAEKPTETFSLELD